MLASSYTLHGLAQVILSIAIAAASDAAASAHAVMRQAVTSVCLTSFKDVVLLHISHDRCGARCCKTLGFRSGTIRWTSTSVQAWIERLLAMCACYKDMYEVQ